MLYAKLLAATAWRGSQALDLTHIPQDYWPGDPAIGQYLVDHQELPPSQAAILDTFSWLRDLRTVGGHVARQAGRAKMRAWQRQMLTSPRRRAQAFVPAIAAVRLVNWLVHYEFFWASAKPHDLHNLTRLIRLHARLLRLPKERDLRQMDALLILKAAFFAALALYEKNIPSLAIKKDLHDTLDLPLPQKVQTIALLLTRALKAQFLPDGGHISGSSHVQLGLLVHLIDIENCIKRIDQPFLSLQQILRDQVAWLRMFARRDNTLADFNGSALAALRTGANIQALPVITQTYGRGRILRNAPQSGFTRRSVGPMTLIYHGGKAWDSKASSHYNAGSFEIMIGSHRLIGSCASDLTQVTPVWRHALAGPDAASQLCITDREPRMTYVTMAAPDAHRVGSRHDGFVDCCGLHATRVLTLAQDGQSISGVDRLTPVARAPSCQILIRFHLDSAVQAIHNVIDQVTLTFGRNQVWALAVKGAKLSLQDSLQVTSLGVRKPSKQITLTRFSLAESHQMDTLVHWRIYKVVAR